MSALWDRNPGIRSYESTFLRDQEFRTVPTIFTFSLAGVGRAGGGGTSIDEKQFNCICVHSLLVSRN